jgi:hypothetical protein
MGDTDLLCLGCSGRPSGCPVDSLQHTPPAAEGAARTAKPSRAAAPGGRGYSGADRDGAPGVMCGHWREPADGGMQMLQHMGVAGP